VELLLWKPDPLALYLPLSLKICHMKESGLSEMTGRFVIKNDTSGTSPGTDVTGHDQCRNVPAFPVFGSNRSKIWMVL